MALSNFGIHVDEIECDAFGRGVGAVLMQLKHPISYFSKAFSGTKLCKSSNGKELVTLVLDIQDWRHYLLGRKFIEYSDHKSI